MGEADRVRGGTFPAGKMNEQAVRARLADFDGELFLTEREERRKRELEDRLRVLQVKRFAAS
ncbi:hypothetical protein [Ramlibacter sp. AN1133]|uniref:hypothetical protein n=1 Tax=Ramlibacter sp. AN1133 TaxID=3133429 RepID=UPI0030BB8A17